MTSNLRTGMGSTQFTCVFVVFCSEFEGVQQTSTSPSNKSICVLNEHNLQHNSHLNQVSAYLQNDRSMRTYKVEKCERQLRCSVLVGSEHGRGISRCQTFLPQLRNQMNTESMQKHSPEGSGCAYKWRQSHFDDTGACYETHSMDSGNTKFSGSSNSKGYEKQQRFVGL